MLVMRCCPITGAVHYLYLILAILVLLVMLAIVVKLTVLTPQYKHLFPICFLYVTKMALNCSWLRRTR